jgi:hypothetical protein
VGERKGRGMMIRCSDERKYMKGRQIGWIINRGCHQKEFPSNFYIMNMIQEGQEDDGLLFEDGMG